MRWSISSRRCASLIQGCATRFGAAGRRVQFLRWLRSRRSPCERIARRVRRCLPACRPRPRGGSRSIAPSAAWMRPQKPAPAWLCRAARTISLSKRSKLVAQFDPRRRAGARRAAQARRRSDRSATARRAPHALARTARKSAPLPTRPQPHTKPAPLSQPSALPPPPPAILPASGALRRRAPALPPSTASRPSASPRRAVRLAAQTRARLCRRRRLRRWRRRRERCVHHRFDRVEPLIERGRVFGWRGARCSARRPGAALVERGLHRRHARRNRAAGGADASRDQRQQRSRAAKPMPRAAVLAVRRLVLNVDRLAASALGVIVVSAHAIPQSCPAFPETFPLFRSGNEFGPKRKLRPPGERRSSACASRGVLPRERGARGARPRVARGDTTIRFHGRFGCGLRHRFAEARRL